MTNLHDALTDPLAWALLAMLGLVAAGVVVAGHPVGRKPAFVTLALVLVTVGRIVLVLPFCEQPRFEPGVASYTLAGVLLLLALVVGVPTMSIRWWRGPQSDMTLRTTGVYALVRNPMYLAELLWPIAWSLLWGSVVGLALTPVWWLGFLCHTLSEEAHLERELGERYAEYALRVRGRFLPGLPF